MFMKILIAFAALLTVVAISLGCGGSEEPVVEDASDVADVEVDAEDVEAGADDGEVSEAATPSDASEEVDSEHPPTDAEEPEDAESDAPEPVG